MNVCNKINVCGNSTLPISKESESLLDEVVIFNPPSGVVKTIS